MTDARTIAVYNAKAQAYADMVAKEYPDAHLSDFAALIPTGGRVLDLGCGTGNAAAYFRNQGLIPDALDASASMIALANRTHEIGARLGTFDDLRGPYAGVWANFSLLHAPRRDLPRHLLAIAEALIDGGHFHIGMKMGNGMARDTIDRMYTYVGEPELQGLITDAGLRVTYTELGEGTGLDGTIGRWIVCRAVKHA